MGYIAIKKIVWPAVGPGILSTIFIVLLVDAVSLLVKNNLLTLFLTLLLSVGLSLTTSFIEPLQKSAYNLFV